MPVNYKSKYKELILYHFDTISVDKTDLGCLKKISGVKVKDPEYRKQSKISDSYKPFLEE
jgi:hypothetical protein